MVDQECAEEHVIEDGGPPRTAFLDGLKLRKDLDRSVSIVELDPFLGGGGQLR